MGKVFEILDHLLYDCTLPYGPQREKPFFGVYKQQRPRPACASAPSDQRLCCSLIGKFHISTCYEHISIFQLVSVAGKAGLNLILSETPNTVNVLKFRTL